MRKGFATLFRDLAVVVVAMAALVGFTGRSDWPLLVIVLAAALSALAFIVLRHHAPQPGQAGHAAAGLPVAPGYPPPLPWLRMPPSAVYGLCLDALPDPVLVLGPN